MIGVEDLPSHRYRFLVKTIVGETVNHSGMYLLETFQARQISKQEIVPILK